MGWLLVNLLVLLANLGVLGISVKVYSETVKAQKLDRLGSGRS